MSDFDDTPVGLDPPDGGSVEKSTDVPPTKRRRGRPPRHATSRPPQGSILDRAPLSFTSDGSNETLDAELAKEDFDVIPLEKRACLRARLVIEEALRDPQGWSKKERVDAAIKTIATLEGTKERLWVTPVEGVSMTEVEYNKERKAAEKRLNELLDRKGRRSVPTQEMVEAALNIIDPTMVKGGDA